VVVLIVVVVVGLAVVVVVGLAVVVVVGLAVVVVVGLAVVVVVGLAVVVVFFGGSFGAEEESPIAPDSFPAVLPLPTATAATFFWAALILVLP